MKTIQQAAGIFMLLVYAQLVAAQALTETTAIRFYEHHSSDMTGDAFGNDANGTQSGYDFVNKRYFNSFDENTFGAYTKGEEANIDMVEHNGPFGTSGASMYLGFTAGVSTIWGGPIKGNNSTKWMKAPAGFDYASAATVSDLSSAYDPSKAKLAVAEVRNGDVFIGRIRQSNLYVALKCSNVHIPSGPPNGQNNDNVYFDFDYKAGGTFTGIGELDNNSIEVYPNPAANVIQVKMNSDLQMESIRVYSLLGTEVLFIDKPASVQRIDMGSFPKGVYLMHIAAVNGNAVTRKIVLK